jgi:mannose-6-phosphate isomerase-like protein (cupin superfamily)
MVTESGIFTGGKVTSSGITVDVETLPWVEHGSFKGVYLKHLVKGDMTGGMFSCHIVRVSAGQEIGDHIHEGKWELHEVVEGSGTGVVGGLSIEYAPGRIVPVPEGVKHRVSAGNSDLYLLAKFVPPLL